MSKNNKHNEYKLLLLIDPSVQKLKYFDKWLEHFFENQENSDSSLLTILRDPEASKHPMWAQQVKVFIEKPDDNLYKNEILLSPQVQLLPEWDKWINTEFGKDKIGFN